VVDHGQDGPDGEIAEPPEDDGSPGDGSPDGGERLTPPGRRRPSLRPPAVPGPGSGDAPGGLPGWPLVILGLGALGVLLRETRAFTIPFAVAVLFSVLLTPLMDRLERWRIPNPAAVLLLLVGLGGFFAGVGALIYEGIRSVTDALPRYSKRAEQTAGWVLDRLDRFLDVDRMGGPQVDLDQRLSQALSSELFLSYVNDGIGSFVSFFSSLLIMLLFLMFMLTSRRAFAAKVYRLLRAEGRDDQETRVLIGSVSDRIQTYLLMKTLVSAGTGVVFGAVAAVCGLDFPVVWGFLAFVFNYVPSIGPLIAVLPPILLAFFQFDVVAQAVLTGGLLLVVNFISGNVVEPKLMGNRLDLNVVVVLLSLFVWGQIWGFVGMLLAVPLTAVINIAMSHSPKYQGVSSLLGR